jgi:hypothetical protein
MWGSLFGEGWGTGLVVVYDVGAIVPVLLEAQATDLKKVDNNVETTIFQSH